MKYPLSFCLSVCLKFLSVSHPDEMDERKQNVKSQRPIAAPLAAQSNQLERQERRRRRRPIVGGRREVAGREDVILFSSSLRFIRLCFSFEMPRGFHAGSLRVPCGFLAGSLRVPCGFLAGSGTRWLCVRGATQRWMIEILRGFHAGSTADSTRVPLRIPCGFLAGSLRVPYGFPTVERARVCLWRHTMSVCRISKRIPLRVHCGSLRILCGFRAMERARGGPVYVAPHSVGSWKFHAGS